jgi:beta-1,4-mannooligosaccharide/beta-1,4-mannosyl-N-acetylglucosamine phosphorylase
MTTGKGTIIGNALPNIPWEDRPRDCREAVWRSRRNPVIPRNAIPGANSIFNSAVVPFAGGFAGVFRCDDRARRMRLHVGRSPDGWRWEIEPDPIRFLCDDPEIGAFQYGYDPRVVWIEDRFWVTWCNGYHGPTIGVAWTKDFKAFHQLENAYLPYNRNGVLFPRKLGGQYVMFSRPSDRGHTPWGDLFLSHSPDMVHWGRHRFVMGPRQPWESTKIGAGPCPIETAEGWLLLYHGVLTSCNGFVYSMGAALLDAEKPWRVLHRTRSYLLAPWETYECVGDTPNVVFPCAALTDASTGRLAIYYGGADTVTCLAFAQVDDLIAHVKRDSQG